MGSRMDSEGWTVVRHGRGRLPSRRRVQQGTSGRGGGMDRAPSGPFRDRTHFHIPNQPVPPFTSSRYLGPQSRSYAAVTRGMTARFGSGGRQGQPRLGDRFRQQPTDPAFAKLVRKLHAVIKMVHHLQNVSPKPGKAHPRMIARMVEVLASMIKPASPTPRTVDLIWGNATNWGYNTLLILEEHYMAGLETMLVDLEGDLVPDWKAAFEVATRWARRNLPRITQDVLDHAEALISSRSEREGDVPAQHEAQGPGQELVVESTRVERQDAQQQTSMVQTAHPQTGSSEQQSSPHQTVGTMTEVMVHAVPPSPVPQHERPLEQRPRRRGLQNACVIPQEDDLLQIEEIRQDSPSDGGRGEPAPAEGSWLLDEAIQEHIGEGEMLTPVSAHARSREQSQEMEQQMGQTSTVGAVSPQNTSEDMFTSTPKPQLLRVTKHVRTERKMIDWGLSVRKKWLMIGDSNLARIPGYSIPDLQIDSYPGANFRHAQALMAKSTSEVVVEKVVLAFGLNCKGQRAKETAIKQLQGAVRAAKKHFPYSEIWVPVINYSPSLSLAERTTLHTLNAHIMRNQPFIPALPSSSFQTEWDNLHWTRQTGRAMLEHWVSHLNLKSP
ncbi:hypothetical protein ACER0C_031691 [Sarotherodon galilaeus]